MSKREYEVLRDWIADFEAAGLVYRFESPTDAFEPMQTEHDGAVAAALLVQVQVVQDLSRKRVHYFPYAVEDVRTGLYFTP